MIIRRQAWWRAMRQDIKLWYDECLTCLRLRKLQTKTHQQPVIPGAAECWEEVMIDLEGANSPPDREGNRHSMTYICCLCHGLLADRAPKSNATEARRMFARRVFRSGTIPSLLRSDRGPELKNALMQEYRAFMGIGRRFGTPWRHVEQGLVEGVQKEARNVMGMLVKGVFQSQ